MGMGDMVGKEGLNVEYFQQDERRCCLECYVNDNLSRTASNF